LIFAFNPLDLLLLFQGDKLLIMSHNQNIWGTEKFLLGLITFIVVFLMLWSYVYYMNDDFLPIVK